MCIDIELERLKALRLEKITQRIGFTLWQLQALEESAAKCLFLVTKAQIGMGVAAAQPLIEKSLGRTFGQTMTALNKANGFSVKVTERFDSLVEERNWLVHQSRSTSRNAVHSNSACEALLQRVQAIADESVQLDTEVLTCVMNFVANNGFSKAAVDKIAAEAIALGHQSNHQN
jgi:hypothetical protein